MRTSRSLSAAVAVVFGLSLCPVELFSTSMPSAPTHSAPPPPKPPPPKPPPVHIPMPDMGRAASEAAQRAAMRAQTAAAEKAASQAQLKQRAAAKPQGPAIYAATKLQRQVAEAHARAYMAALRRAEAEEDAEEAAYNNDPNDHTAERRLTKQTTTTTQKSRTSPSSQSQKPPAKKPQVSSKDAKKKTPPPKPKKKKKKKKKRKKRPRYIAVNTVKDKRATPKAKKVVMIWDTYSERLVGNNVYEVETTPPLGAELKFETFFPAYVGDGVLVQ